MTLQEHEVEFLKYQQLKTAFATAIDYFKNGYYEKVSEVLNECFEEHNLENVTISELNPTN